MFYRKKKSVYSKKIHEQWALIKEGSDHYIELNQTAGYLWKHLEKPVSLEKLSELLSKRYTIPLPQAFSDSKDFIDCLSREKMIEVV
jgi:hypothetical protein